MPTIKELAQSEETRPRFSAGHSLCAGCGIPTVVRTVLASIPGPVVVVNATGCLEVATTRYPFTAWGVPWMHVAFENASAVMSGVEAAYRSLTGRGETEGERVTFVVFGGDGGTYDIGLQSLSGALERGHRFLYICYDNEAYMNTGIQRSGATPFGAATTTSPAGRTESGKKEQAKDMMAIVVAHHIPYAAQAAISHWQDLSEKVVRAVSFDGPSFLNVLSSCPPGWGYEAKDTVQAVRLAVDANYWPLFEVVEGHYRITHTPRSRVPLREWLSMQKRFRHLEAHGHEALLARLQGEVDARFEDLVERAERDAAWFRDRKRSARAGLPLEAKS